MKYFKKVLFAMLLLTSTGLFAQEPCTELGNKTVKDGSTIYLDPVIPPIYPQTPTGDLTITCPDDITITLEGNETSTEVTWSNATATTECLTGGVNISLLGSLTSGTYFTEGSYTIEYQATDDCGNTSACNFKIWVGKYKPTVIFVHGLGGSEFSMNQAELWTQLNFSNAKSVTYGESGGLAVAGKNLTDDIQLKVGAIMGNADTKSNRERNYIIAHSQGGIISQFAEMYTRNTANTNGQDWKDNIYYGGIVTFASPHKGAYILNSVVEDKAGNYVYKDNNPNTSTRFEDFARSSTKALSAGEISNLKIPAFVKIIAPIAAPLINMKIKNVAEGIVDLLTKKIIAPMATGDFVKPTALGYIVNPPSNIPSINTIDDFFITNAPSDGIHKIAFYSIIDEDNEKTQGEMAWREAYWTINSPNSQPPTSFDFGSATLPAFTDGQMQADKYRHEYFVRADEAREHAEYHLARWWELNHKAKAKDWSNKQEAWGKGVQWFDTANNQFKTLIGSMTYSVEDFCACDCITETYGSGNEPFGTNSFNIPCENDCQDYNSTTIVDGVFTSQTCTRRITVNSVVKPCDGAVLAESASQIAGATINENTPGYTKDDFILRGSIHQQMRSDQNFKKKLEGEPQNGGLGLYTGGYGKYFKLNN